MVLFFLQWLGLSEDTKAAGREARKNSDKIENEGALKTARRQIAREMEQNCEVVCEGHGYKRDKCESTQGCEWAQIDGQAQCMSAVGSNPCDFDDAPDTPPPPPRLRHRPAKNLGENCWDESSDEPWRNDESEPDHGKRGGRCDFCGGGMCRWKQSGIASWFGGLGNGYHQCVNVARVNRMAADFKVHDEYVRSLVRSGR